MINNSLYVYYVFLLFFHSIYPTTHSRKDFWCSCAHLEKYDKKKVKMSLVKAKK